MWDLPPQDYNIDTLQVDLKPKTHYEERLESYPQMSKEVWGVVIEVKDWVTKVVKKAEVTSDTKKETKDLYETLTVEQKIERINKIYKLENIDELLSNPNTIIVLESYIGDLWWTW